MKKSYHSMALPATEAVTTRRVRFLFASSSADNAAPLYAIVIAAPWIFEWINGARSADSRYRATR
ncbi:hypothetical protein D3C77_616470 [compost metagenome]